MDTPLGTVTVWGMRRFGADSRSDGYNLTARFYDLVVEPLNAPLRAAARRFHPAPARGLSK